MPKPFANAPQYNGVIDDSYIIGLQTGRDVDSAGLEQMMYISIGQLKKVVTQALSALFTFRGVYSSTVPDNLATNDYFYCNAEFTDNSQDIDDGEGNYTHTFHQYRLYAYNGKVWADMTDGIKGPKGDTGDPAGFGTPSASVDDQIGTPSVEISTSGPDTAKIFSFIFHNLKGQTGATGATGNGISSIDCYYAVTNTQTQPNPSDITSVVIPSMSLTDKYLWQKMVVTYTSGSVETIVILVCVYGDKGDKGDTGSTGATGNGISSIDCYYAVTNTQTQPNPSDITSMVIPAMSSTDKYLWQKMIITYTSGSTETFVVLVCVYGDTGATGATGATGQSVTVASQSVQYQGSASGTVIPMGTWLDNIPSVPPGEFLWTRIKVTFAPSGEFTAYSVGYQGEDDISELEAKVGSLNWEEEESEDMDFNEKMDERIGELTWNDLIPESVDHLRVVSVPASSSATGSAGDVSFDSSYLYVCVSSNTWKRIALSSF